MPVNVLCLLHVASISYVLFVLVVHPHTNVPLFLCSYFALRRLFIHLFYLMFFLLKDNIFLGISVTLYGDYGISEVN